MLQQFGLGGRLGYLMRSPVDANSALVRDTLPGGLNVLRCEKSGGVWIRPSFYWQWLEHHAPDGAAAGDGVDAPATDSRAGKRCPEDGYFLIRHRVGNGLDFHVDRCGHCGGMWLDRGEWEALLRHGLAEKLHLVFSSAWQAAVRHQRDRDTERALLVQRLGDAEYQKLVAFADHLVASPHRHAMVAYLQEAVSKHYSG